MAARSRSAAGFHQAIGTLCEAYWIPMYTYLRRLGCSRDEAEDMVQEFCRQLLEKDVLAHADPNRGRFRAFLLKSLRNFVANQRGRARAQKRGGRTPLLSLEVEAAERWYRLEPADHMTPERIYDKRWALTVLDRVMRRLRGEFVRSGKLQLFETLKPLLVGDSADVCYQELAARLHTSHGAVRVAVHRLRRRYKDLLWDEIRQTVARPDDISAEVDYLRSAVSS